MDNHARYLELGRIKRDLQVFVNQGYCVFMYITLSKTIEKLWEHLAIVPEVPQWFKLSEIECLIQLAKKKQMEEV